MSQQDLFGRPLESDQAVRLTDPADLASPRPGPLHRVQYVIELVGPRSVPAAAAASLLDPRWFQALGQPEMWCMGPMDSEWRTLTNASDGAYDSIALAWDQISSQGVLNEASAKSLLARAEEYASHIQRRAMPMPVPEDVPASVRNLQEARSSLDIGFSLAFAPTSGYVPERDLWIQCARMGLVLGPSGAFEWLGKGQELPMLEVTPIGQTETFSLAAVERGDVHEGASIGFHYALSPSPKDALEGCFHVGGVLCESIGGRLLDDEGKLLSSGARQRLRAELEQAERLFANAGIKPGSREAAKLWSGWV
ncbi:MAG TPA: hypothetical protein VGE01_13300 [Fimbriimonas sp.]